MTNGVNDFQEFHWIMDIIQSIDVGLVVINREYEIQLWNSFMENHSVLDAHSAKGKNLLETFPNIPRQWFKHKVESVFLLKNSAFSVWEQRDHLFRFKNYRPITGTEEYMYQNISMIPLISATGEVNQVCIIIYDVTDIASNRKQLQAANEELAHLSRTDRLTQLNNRGFWEEALEKDFKRFKRYNQPSSLVMFDIDHFKKVNDTYGHQAGDEVIRQVAQALRENLRDVDVAGRYGGEEFGVILPGTDADGAMNFCERLRKHVESLVVEHDEHKIRFTISLGISQLSDSLDAHTEWLEQSDQALYKSKESGRNCTNIFGK